MTKEIIKLDGSIAIVPIDTICKCVDGKHYELSQAELDELEQRRIEGLAEQKLFAFKEIRFKRNELISSTDYLLLPDTSLNASQIDELKIYRQNLRDVTKQSDNPDEIIFPTKPSFVK